MLKRFIVPMLVLIGFASGFLINMTLTPQFNRYEVFSKTLHQHYMRLQRGIDSQTIVFVGSSTIQAIPTNKLPFQSLSMGIGGETISELAVRLVDYPSIGKSKALVVGAGVNDVCWVDASAIENSLLAILEFPRLVSVPIYYIAIQNVAIDSLCPSVNRRIEVANDLSRRVCEKVENCEFVDLDGLVNENGTIKHQYYEQDGVHFNGLGYRVLIDLLIEKMNI